MINIGTLDNLKIDLSTSAQKIRKELVQMPIIGCKSTLQHMTLRPGLRKGETVGQIGGNMQFGPYSNSYKDNNNVTINPRTLEVFFGSVIKDFDPNEVATSIWGSSMTKGEALKNTEIVQLILPYLMKKLGGNLNAAIWNGTRNAAGHTTADLFNGFDTITAAEITATNISTTNGNLQNFSEAISSTNAVDILRGFVQSAAPELQGLEVENDPVKLFCSYDIYNLYNEAYQSVVGPVVYNTGYTKRFIEGTNVELVPLVNKTGSSYVTLAPQSNMLIGVNQVGEEETVQVDRFSAFVLTLSATLFFGTQFESISKERLCIGKLYSA